MLEVRTIWSCSACRFGLQALRNMCKQTGQVQVGSLELPCQSLDVAKESQLLQVPLRLRSHGDRVGKQGFLCAEDVQVDLEQSQSFHERLGKRESTARSMLGKFGCSNTCLRIVASIGGKNLLSKYNLLEIFLVKVTNCSVLIFW